MTVGFCENSRSRARQGRAPRRKLPHVDKISRACFTDLDEAENLGIELLDRLVPADAGDLGCHGPGCHLVEGGGPNAGQPLRYAEHGFCSGALCVERFGS